MAKEQKKAKQVEPEEKKAVAEKITFDKYFKEVYLPKQKMDAPHHPDAHGLLGYETNVVKYETFTKATGKYETHEVNGFCLYCSLSQKSAKEEYGQYLLH